MKYLFTFLVIILLTNSGFGQLARMSLEGKPQKSNDEIVAKRDANGRYCAAIKVVSDMEGFSYDAYNGVVAVDDRPGEDMVYLQPDERVLIIYHKGYEPLKLVLSDYGIQLRPKEVWRIRISGEPKMSDRLPVVFFVQPSDAQVQIDGKTYEVSDQKPVSLTPGKHQVKILKRGYRPVEQTIDVDKDHVVFKFELQEMDLVPVTINSRPAGAQIYLDGMQRGVTSKAMNLFPGTYELKLTLNGYVPLNRKIEVKENAPNVFDFNLTKNAGYLQLDVQPPDATLTINGKIYQPTGTIELLPGTYHLTLSKSGYLDITDQVEIKVGQRLKRTYRLQKNSGTLILTIQPATARVLINKEDYGTKRQIELAPGLYRLEIQAEGYKGISENINIVRGQTLRRNYVLKQKVGKLNFAVSPANARVILKRNGQTVKEWQGAAYLKNLPVGEYQLQVTAKGFASRIEPVFIRENHLANMDVTLKKGLTISYKNPLGIEWVWVEGGSFEMGCTSEQNNCWDDEKPVHTVTVDGFYISKYEVTNRQYIDFLNAIGANGNGSHLGRKYIDMDDADCAIGYRNGRFYFKGSSVAPSADCPVVEVSWYGAVAFCEWMSKKTGRTIRLPTEAEWEYAARGGKKSRGYKYAGSNNVDAVAWYSGNSGGKTHPIGQKQPNELGLYDMSGNVWEWCLDWYDSKYYSKSPRHNPRGPNSGMARVLRGGNWYYDAFFARVSVRYCTISNYMSIFIGFRILRTK